MPWACRAGQAVSSASALHSSSCPLLPPCACFTWMNSQFAAWPLSWQRVLPPASCGSSIHRCNRVCVCVWVCSFFSFYHSVCFLNASLSLSLVRTKAQRVNGPTGSEHYESTNIRMADRIIDARFFFKSAAKRWPQTRSSGSYSLPHSTRVSHASALSLSLSSSLLPSAISDCRQIDRSLYRILTSIRQFEIHVWDTVQLFHLRQAAASEHDLAYLRNRSR